MRTMLMCYLCRRPTKTLFGRLFPLCHTSTFCHTIPTHSAVHSSLRMGRLSKLLPKPVLRYLQKILNPPKSQNGKYLSYTDTLVILRIPRDGSEPSFRFLNGVIHSMHDSCPSILRCEMHSYIHKHTYVTVQITYVVHLFETIMTKKFYSLRFNNAFDAMNFKVDGLPFQGWLEQREADHLWTCVL